MAKFKVEFMRRVTTYETVTRVIEADTAADAEDIADTAASEFNCDCPDDVMEKDGWSEFGGWSGTVGDVTDEPANYPED